MVKNELIEILNSQLNVELATTISQEALHQKLSAYINELIEKDFQKLVLILYKVDVNENKLKLLLQNNQTKNASEIIATLIIERELQKIKSRKQFNTTTDNDEVERW